MNLQLGWADFSQLLLIGMECCSVLSYYLFHSQLYNYTAYIPFNTKTWQNATSCSLPLSFCFLWFTQLLSVTVIRQILSKNYVISWSVSQICIYLSASVAQEQPRTQTLLRRPCNHRQLQPPRHRVSAWTTSTLFVYVCLLGGEARCTATQEDSTVSLSHRHTYIVSCGVCACEGEKNLRHFWGMGWSVEYD